MVLARRQFLAAVAVQTVKTFPGVPRDYLVEPSEIPAFWVTAYDDVQRYLASHVRKGRVEEIGRSAGGRVIRAVSYGVPRAGKGTTTFSGALGFGDVAAYRGPDHERTVYFGMACVHGAEFEGIAGMVNLLSVLETGADLRGKPWPAIVETAARLGRVVLVPVANPDGRARIPVRMVKHRGSDHFVQEYLNTGGRPDGKLIGWPQVKQHIPLDFSTVQFPGGYPNDAGINIQHDDFFGARQPETQALFDLARRERPDLVMNLHTGAVFMHPLRPFVEPALIPAWEQSYRRIMTALTEAGLQKTNNPSVEADPARERMSPYNLDTALNLHCGTLAMVVESPSHNFSSAVKDGKPLLYTPDMLVDAQLILHREAMGFLADTGGRARWTAPRR
jgi:hypothetical protein